RKQRWKRFRKEPRIEGIGKLLTSGHKNIRLGDSMSVPHLGRPGPGTSPSLVAKSILPYSIANILQFLRTWNIGPSIKGKHPRRTNLMNRLRCTINVHHIVVLLTISTTLLLYLMSIAHNITPLA